MKPELIEELKKLIDIYDEKPVEEEQRTFEKNIKTAVFIDRHKKEYVSSDYTDEIPAENILSVDNMLDNNNNLITVVTYKV